MKQKRRFIAVGAACLLAVTCAGVAPALALGDRVDGSGVSTPETPPRSDTAWQGVPSADIQAALEAETTVDSDEEIDPSLLERDSVASERAHDIQSWFEGRDEYAAIALDNDRRKIIVYVKSLPSAQVQKKIEALAVSTPVVFVNGSLASDEEVVTMIESMYDKLDPKRKRLGPISPNVRGTKVSVGIQSGEDDELLAAEVTKALSPLRVDIQFLDSRQDVTPF